MLGVYDGENHKQWSLLEISTFVGHLFHRKDSSLSLSLAIMKLIQWIFSGTTVKLRIVLPICFYQILLISAKTLKLSIPSHKYVQVCPYIPN